MLFGFSPAYVLIMVVCMGMAGLASLYVKSRFARGQQVPLQSRMSGREVAERILDAEGISAVAVHEHDGFLSDHYNPATRTLHLSPPVYRGRDAAAAGVAAHEVGHALQHARGDLSMWGRTILVYPAHFGSMLAPLLLTLGVFMAGGHALLPGTAAHGIAVAGVLLFGVSTLCSLIILANELNASKRARLVLAQLGITRPGEEDDTVRGVLNAAAMTYLAAALTSLLQLLYFASLVFGQRREE
jgi:Zn-dependent membrane protease YugP